MKRFLILTVCAALFGSLGCGPHEEGTKWCPDDLDMERCRDVLVARAKNQADTQAMQIYGEAMEARGELSAYRSMAVIPSKGAQK